MRPAVFIDRDDTLIEANSLPPPPPPAKRGDVVDPAHVRLHAGAGAACRALREAGLVPIVFSNQGVVARGGATRERVEEINARVLELLEQEADWRRPGPPLIEAFYYCPYHPKGAVAEFTREHEWRKPAPGMILAAARDLGLDLSRSWVIGDAPRDIEAGIAAGIEPPRCLLIGPGSRWPSFAAAAAAVVAAHTG